MGFAKDCWPFVLPVLGLAGFLFVVGYPRWAIATGAIGLLLLLFFRIPQRPQASRTAGILSPANGKILAIEEVAAPDVGPGSRRRIIIFLSVFNIHVQRSPVTGVVVTSRYSSGRKVAAFDSRAGDINEQQLTVLQRPNGDLIGVRQIAGLLARRVVTYLQQEQPVAKGDLIGVIKFGSRVDLLVPVSYHVTVEVGQKVIEGQTVMARLEEEDR